MKDREVLNGETETDRNRDEETQQERQKNRETRN